MHRAGLGPAERDGAVHDEEPHRARDESEKKGHGRPENGGERHHLGPVADVGHPGKQQAAGHEEQVAPGDDGAQYRVAHIERILDVRSEEPQRAEAQRIGGIECPQHGDGGHAAHGDRLPQRDFLGPHAGKLVVVEVLGLRGNDGLALGFCGQDLVAESAGVGSARCGVRGGHAGRVICRFPV